MINPTISKVEFIKIRVTSTFMPGTSVFQSETASYSFPAIILLPVAYLNFTARLLNEFPGYDHETHRHSGAGRTSIDSLADISDQLPQQIVGEI